MKKINLFTLALAVAAGSLVSCTTKEISIQEGDLFHVVHFETSQAETKTTMEIEGTTVNFNWEETDYDAKLQRFHVWEDSNEALRVDPKFSDGKLSLDATFNYECPEEANYVGFLNGTVPALQVPRDNQYDADADVLAARSTLEDGTLYFQFQRVVAVGKLTLKGIDEGETLQSVTFELAKDSDQFLTASLSKDWEWGSTGKKITLNCNHTIGADKTSPALFFTCVPVTNGMFTVKAVTDKNTYTKEFGKAISLTKGNVKGMSVTMEKDEKNTETLIINLSTFTSPNPTLTTAYNNFGTDKEFSVKTHKFLGSNIIKNPNNQPAGYSEGDILVLRSGTGNIQNKDALSLLNITIISLTTDYGVTAGNSTSSMSSVTGTSNQDVTVTLTGARNQTMKSKTYSLEGKQYFKISATAALRVHEIIVTVGESTPTGIKLNTPSNLEVNSDKQVVWDRVENAGSYNVYIANGQAINVTDHHYDASSLEDGYYNVAVEAVPTNSEMFVTSDKATLENAKFGTPTLATPVPEVAKTDKTITLSWNVDAHADNGYAYTLYQDEEVVESPSADYSASEGVATLVYSNLSPKTAYSVKVNAKLVESPLRYEASEVYTSDVITTLSTINYAVLQNGEYSSENPTFIAPDEDVMFTATPNAGYEFESVSVTGVDAENIERDDDVYSFTMPDLAEVTVTVIFKQSGFTLVVADDIENGTIVIDEPQERYTVTDLINLTVTPNAHYEVVPNSVVARKDGETDIHATHLEGTAYQLTGLQFDAQIVAGFKKIDYAISLAEGIANGTVTRGAETATYNQENVSFTVKPDSGYQISTVTVSGASGSVEVVAGTTDDQGTHYTFTMPGEPVTIAATFSAIDYTVTGVAISDSCHGSVTADKTSGVHIGETVTLTVTPEYDWYQLKAGTLKVNNGAVTLKQEGTSNEYTFTMPAANATVAAEFEKKSYNISDQSGSNGSLSFIKNSTNVSTAQYGDEVEIVVTPASADYELTPSTLRAYKYGGGESLTITDSRFTMKNFSVSVTADFRKKTFSFTKDGSSNLSFDIQNTGGTSIATSGSVSGETIKLVASGVHDGKQAKWTVTGTSGQISTTAVAGTDNQAIFTMPVSDVTIKCEEGDAETVVTFSNLGYTSWGQSSSFSGSTYDELSQSKDNVKFDYVRGNGSTYANNTSTRFYKDNKLTFTVPSGCTITSITWTGSNFKNDVTTNVATCTSTASALSWTGNAQTVTFTRPSNADSYITLSSVEVIYTGSPVGGDEPNQLLPPTDLAWTESTKTLSWTDSNTGKGTYNTNYKYQYSVNGGSSWLDATSSTTAVLTIASTTTVKVKAVAITTATHNSSFEADMSCTITQNTPQTATFTMKNSGQSSPVTINGVTFSWTSSNIATGTNNSSGFKSNSNMTITIPAGKKLTGISKSNGNNWGTNASIVVKTNNSNGSTIATIVHSNNDYSITSNNTGTTYYLSNTTTKNAWINSLSITYE